MGGNPSKNPAIWHSMENDPWNTVIWAYILRIYHNEHGICIDIRIYQYIEILYCYIAIYSWYRACYTMRTRKNSHDVPWYINYCRKSRKSKLILRIYNNILSIYKFTAVYPGICWDMHVQNILIKSHNMGIQTVKLAWTSCILQG